MEASLVNRLAGPSTGKAGLANDQTEINRIIAEASKGSPFFDNEKRKDKELTEKIGRLLKHRDEMLRGIDVGKLEASIDKTLVDLETKRDLTQYIVHVDMDAFFASVELLDDPSLKGKPFGVGKGVLTTASYEARLYGVRSGMAGFIARKLCPQLILVPIRPERYGEMSSKVMDVFKRYDANMLAAGTDEAYLNITHYCQTNGLSPDACVQKLRAEVHAETSLTASPYHSLKTNKPNGQFQLPFEREGIVAFMHDLPIRKIPGIGRVTERLLDSIGVKTCGDIHAQRATLSVLDKQFHLHSLLLTHLGIASNDVQPGQREERKSVGSERTFRPISDDKKIMAKLESCAADLEEDMERTGWAGRTITLKYKLDTFQVFTRAKSSTRYINRKEELFAIGKRLLMPEFPLTIRLIGLRVTKLKDLRAPEGQGLKRFFESGQASPSKKRQKLDHAPDEDLETSEHVLEEEQAMAEYEDDLDEQTLVDDEETTAPTEERQVCPICSKVFDTDNAGLNEHIDFCLSKGAILAATAVTHGHSPKGK
ncbi:IMS-domain-containing protein [Gautieria morchelliformis]|nr:IMS-domain-containing protein [Gautieria morchelliformis]